MSIRFSLALLVALCGQSWLQAQQVIAYVDADAVLKAMPVYRDIRKNLETFQAQLAKGLEEDKRAIAQYYTKVIEQVKRGELTKEQQQQAEVRLQQMQVDLQTKTEDADRRLMDREQALSKPMYQAFENALEAVAKKQGYTYIFDVKLVRSINGGINATAQLKRQLGL